MQTDGRLDLSWNQAYAESMAGFLFSGLFFLNRSGNARFIVELASLLEIMAFATNGKSGKCQH
jgi:hypothetical protein